MRVSQTFEAYNARRYSKPWIAIITAWPIGSKPTLRFGGFVGNDRDGGEAEIDAQPGDIVRWGQADHRGNKTDSLWGIVQIDGAILSCHEPQARQHWTQRQQAQHDTTAIEIAPMRPQQQDAMTPLQLPSNTPILLELPRHAEPDATPEPVQAAQPPQQQTIAPDIREIDPTAAHYIQSRAQMDFALVVEYAQMMRDGVEFDVAQGIENADGTIYIYDGYHRGEAAKAAGVMLRVTLRPGTRADAEWQAFAANVKHGLRRTHADIERIVKNALAHPNAANMSDRELARHCGTDHKTVGNWRRRLAEKRKNESGEIPHVPTPDAPTQTEIEGTEKPEYTLAEIREIVEDYLPKDAIDRASMLNNLISKTVAGQAYQREIVGLLRSNPMRSCERLDANLRIVYGLIINTLPSDNSGGAGLDALTVLQVEHDKIATTFEDAAAIEANAGEADETPTAQRAQAKAVLADAQAYLTATAPQPEAATDAPIPHLEMIGKRYRTPYGVGRINGIMQDGSFNADFQSKFGYEIRNLKPEELLEEAQKDAAPAPRPVEIEQMRCAGCGSMFPPRELTYNTGLCRTCLDFQLTLLAERQPLIAATFRVLERRLLGGFAAEIKRDIYEEIYAPTPEPEAAPTPEPIWICANCETSQTGEKYNFRINGQPQKVCNACWSKLSSKLVTDTKTTLQKIDEKHKQQAEPSEPEPQPAAPAVKDLCAACEWHRGREAAEYGKTLGQHYFGKCIRSDGYCEPVAALIATAAPKADAPDPRDRVLYYKQQGLSVRKIADALRSEGITMSKSAVSRTLQEQKEAEAW